MGTPLQNLSAQTTTVLLATKMAQTQVTITSEAGSEPSSGI